MNDETRTILTDTVTDVLERFSFLFADPPDDMEAESSDERYHSTIAFNGPSEGTISITAPDPICKDIAANVLGELDTDDLPPEAAGDALKELLNIVCGELVAELFGREVVIDLTVPSLETIDQNRWAELSADENSVMLIVDDHPLIASLHLTNEKDNN